MSTADEPLVERFLATESASQSSKEDGLMLTPLDDASNLQRIYKSRSKQNKPLNCQTQWYIELRASYC